MAKLYLGKVRNCVAIILYHANIQVVYTYVYVKNKSKFKVVLAKSM